MSDFLSISTQQASSSLSQNQADSLFEKAKRLAATGQTPNLTDAQKEEIEEAAKGFEKIFMSFLVKELRKTVNKADFLEGQSSTSKMYDDMFDDKLVTNLTEESEMGIADMVRQQLYSLHGNMVDPRSEEFKKYIAEQAAKYQKLNEEVGEPNPAGAVAAPNKSKVKN